LWINQILGEHKVGDLKIKLGVSYNIIDGYARVQNILEMKIQVTNYQASQLLITIDTFKN
jgi:hypothetical protein